MIIRSEADVRAIEAQPFDAVGRREEPADENRAFWRLVVGRCDESLGRIGLLRQPVEKEAAREDEVPIAHADDLILSDIGRDRSQSSKRRLRDGHTAHPGQYCSSGKSHRYALRPIPICEYIEVEEPATQGESGGNRNWCKI